MVIAFIVTAAFMFALRPLAYSAGLIDSPGGRKLHSGDVPIIGGMAMFIGALSGLVIIESPDYATTSLVSASLLLIMVGALDDRYGVPAAVRILVQIASILVMAYGANLALASLGNPFGFGEIVLGPFTLIGTLIVSITVINAYNLVDGADGLAGILALIALAAVAVVGGPGAISTVIALTVLAAILGFLRNASLTGVKDVGYKFFKCVEIGFHAEEEYAAVPEVFTPRNIRFRCGEVRLLDETLYGHGRVAFGHSFNVAKAGFRTCRHDAERHQVPIGRSRHPACHCILESLDISDDMVCWHDQQDRIVIFLLRQECGQCCGRRRVPTFRFKYDLCRLVDLQQLFRHQESVCFVANHYAFASRAFQTLKPKRGFLQHGSIACQRQKLLWIHRPGSRPQART